MKFLRPVLMIAMMFAPAVAFAEAPRTLQELAADIVDILDATTAVLILVGIVVYFWGISTNILSFSEDGMEKVKAYFFWGIIVLFVMVSIWGILGLLQNTLFGGSPNDPSTGESAFFDDDFGVPQFVSE